MTGRRLQWVELSADYRCNNRCRGCFSARDDGPELSQAELAAALREGRARGADSLWLGGGEPTLRQDLFRIVKAARALGYRRVRLQTNGMLLAHRPNVERLRAAGITEVSVSLKGGAPETHDRITSTPGCFALVERAVTETLRAGIPCDADYLAYADNIEELPRAVERFAALGVRSFDVWTFSALDARGEDLTHLIPTHRAVMEAVLAARAVPGGAAARVRPLHVPRCLLDEATLPYAFDARALDLLVVAPGGSFRLEESSIEGGAYGQACDRCSLRPGCSGVRRDYLAVHGETELRPHEAAP